MTRRKVLAFVGATLLSGQVLFMEVSGGVQNNWIGTIERQLIRPDSSGPVERLYARTDLFFGRGKPDGSIVTEAEFRRFLDEEVTPRFPDGLTALAGAGQFRDSSGLVTREDSVLLILLYPTEDKTSGKRIEEIRNSYRNTFHQESVLRVDSRTTVSF